MTFLSELQKYASDKSKNLQVDEIIFGRDYCCVKNQYKSGISMHYFEPSHLPSTHTLYANLPLRFTNDLSPQKPWDQSYTHKISSYLTRNWQGKDLFDLISYVGSNNPILASLAIASINSIFNTELTNENSSFDFLDLLDLQNAKQIGMIGYFYPVVEKLKQFRTKLLIFELKHNKNFIPPERQIEFLPKCDTIICTATTLVNGTFEQILTNTTNTTNFALVGPTVPMIPQLFKDTPVTLLASSVITDFKGLKHNLLQGVGGKSLKPFMKKTIVTINEPQF